MALLAVGADMWASMAAAARANDAHCHDKGDERCKLDRVDRAQGCGRQSRESARHLCLAVILRFAVVGHVAMHSRHLHRHGAWLDTRADGEGKAPMIIVDHVAGGHQQLKQQRGHAQKQGNLALRQKDASRKHNRRLRLSRLAVTKTFRLSKVLERCWPDRWSIKLPELSLVSANRENAS
jgi:hypothetical protein